MVVSITEGEIRNIFNNVQRVAVVGLSDKPWMPSVSISWYFDEIYDVVPVNPKHVELMDRPCYPSLADVPGQVDMAVIFQRSEEVPRHVDAAIAKGVRYFWMQSGIRNRAARDRLEAAGLFVVEDRSIKVYHMMLSR